MRVRLSDVAKAAGVHQATASRALNERTRHLISAETVDRVLRAAAELKYAPNAMAQGLAAGKSSTIGVIIGDLSVPLFPPILRGIDDSLSAAGYTALIVNTDNDPERERARLLAMQARSVDGLIVATATIGDGADPDFYTRVAPTVFVVRAPEDSDVSRVLSDDATGVHALVDHLVRLGHRRILHVAGPHNISTAIARFRAYREALFEHGIEFDPNLVVELEQLRLDHSIERIGERIDRGIQKNPGAGAVPDFTAVLTFNDLVAFGAYRAIRARGLECPRDVSVVGFNDMTGADLVAPPLTTVAIDHYEMGVQAGGIMVELLRQGNAYKPHEVRLPVRLVERESTAEPRPQA